MIIKRIPKTKSTSYIHTLPTVQLYTRCHEDNTNSTYLLDVCTVVHEVSFHLSAAISSQLFHPPVLLAHDGFFICAEVVHDVQVGSDLFGGFPLDQTGDLGTAKVHKRTNIQIVRRKSQVKNTKGT